MVYRADPVTQRDGSSLANSNCRMASIATGLDFHTLGAKTSTGSKMRSYTDDQSGGTDSGDARQSWDRGYDQSLTVRDGNPWSEVIEALNEGRLVHLDVWHATVGGPCLSGSGAYGHTVAVAPEKNSEGKWLVADPWCSPPKWVWWPESKLKAGAEEWGRRVYSKAEQDPSWPTAGQSERRAILRIIIKGLMTLYHPGNPSPPDEPPDTGGTTLCLFTTTKAQTGGGSVADIEVRDPNAYIYDMPDNTKLLNLDGSLRDTVEAGRNNLTSPFGSVTPGGTATRTLIWERDGKSTLLLAAYTNSLTNQRPACEDCPECPEPPGKDEIRAERDAEWIDHLTPPTGP